MAKFVGSAVLASMSLLAAACTQTAAGPPPGMTVAQGQAYYTKLTNLYAEYVAGVSSAMGGVGRGGGQPDIDARLAIAQCQEGETGAGIPVLQRELRNNKIDVPPPPA